MFCNTNKPEDVGRCSMLSAVTEPVNQIAQEPVNQIAQEPVNQISQEPVNQIAQEPVNQIAQDCCRTGEHVHQPTTREGTAYSHHREFPAPWRPALPPQQTQTWGRGGPLRARPETATPGAEDRHAPRACSCRGWDVGAEQASGPPRPGATGYDARQPGWEVDMDPPLPLRSDLGNPVRAYGRPAQQPYCRGTEDARLCLPAGGGYREWAGQGCDYPAYPYGWPAPCHSAWPGLHPCVAVPHGRFTNPPLLGAFYSVNVPRFSTPPKEGVKMNLALQTSPAGAAGGVSDPQEKRRNISLPDECRNIFVTYSEDAASEMVPFAEFLTKQGFLPAIDTSDSSVRRMDINKWIDSHLKDQSVLIIIAISPKYKAEVEGPGSRVLGLHTKYIYYMMQNEFIQQGCLNFRFVPVLFLDATQRHVPGWLQNTRVYRWPRDVDDLRLRLLRVERYIAPPVPMELALIITPVAASHGAAVNL